MSLTAGRLRFTVPPELEAHEPPEARGLARDQVRLLISRHDGKRIEHARFYDLPDFLRPGDLLVANDSATLPAALTTRYSSDEARELPLHLSNRLVADLWAVEPRDLGDLSLKAGDRLDLPAGGAATLLAPYAGSRRLWVARLALPSSPVDYLSRWGRPISYSYLHGSWPIEYYQTVYACEPGSAEMPSAGRAFSQAILHRLAERGIGFVTLTLHTGVASLEWHEPPYPEHYRVPLQTAEAVRDTRSAGGRVIAVGTTVVRALESAVDAAGQPIASQGWTDLVITPRRGVRVVDGLLTGFHEPEATHLDMLEAIASRGHLERAYRAALDGGYLWHEFGDLNLLLP